MNILVLDVETTMLAPTASRSTPFSSLNKVVAVGYRKGIINKNFTVSFDAPTTIYLTDTKTRPAAVLSLVNFFNTLDKATLIVGHNIGGFDLNWIRKLYNRTLASRELIEAPDFTRNLGVTTSLWDTQIVAYLLSGQSMISPSLDELASMYELPLKDSAIKQYWSNGVSTDQIPRQELLDYLEHDVLVTSQIFDKQLQTLGDLKSKNENIFNFIHVQMLARLATAEMEWNGMCFNVPLANKYKVELSAKLDKLTDTIKTNALQILKIAGNTVVTSFNPASPHDIKLLLYGGIHRTEEHRPVLDENGREIVYKSGIKRGEVKTKKELVYVPILGVLPSNITTELETNRYELNSSEETLTKILHLLTTSTILILSDVRRLLQDILEYRSLAKEISTYLIGYSLEVQADGYIHTSYNHTVTRTGRLSSSKPNLQNISAKSHDY